MKKLISVVMSMVMVFSFSTIASVTASAKTISGTGIGVSAKYTLNTSTGYLNITGTGSINAGTSCAPWNGDDVKTVKINEGITDLGAFSFNGCEKISKIILPSTLKNMGQNTFCDGGIGSDSSRKHYQNLKCITIPKSVKYLCDFYYCGSLQKIYYQGSKSDWSKIKMLNFEGEPIKGDLIKNAHLSGVTIQYNSPNLTSVKALTPYSKAIKVTVAKPSGVAGYVVKCSTSSSFSKSTTKTATLKGRSTTTKKFSKLKAKKKYYVKARAYKVVNGKRVYGEWSTVKTVTTK